MRGALSTFQSGQTITGNTFDDCGQVTHGGANMNDCKFKNYEGIADTSYLIYNETADPNGEMDNTSFTKGTAATHAIEFGTASPLTMTLNGIDFSGYTNSVGSTSAPLHIKRISGTVTINVSGCTGITSDRYKSDGATVVIKSAIRHSQSSRPTPTSGSISPARARRSLGLRVPQLLPRWLDSRQRFPMTLWRFSPAGRRSG